MIFIFKNLYKRGKYIIKREGLIIFFRKGFSFLTSIFYINIQKAFSIIDNFLLNASLRKLKGFMDNERTLTDIIETSYNFRGFGVYKTIMPVQYKEELLLFAEIINENSPRILVEIGTAYGGTLYVLCRFLRSLERIISIDLDDRHFQLGYFKMRTKLLKQFAKDKEMHFLIGNSHDSNIETKLCEILGDKKIDVLFIDGDHSYAGVKDDFERYKKYIAIGGVIAFHDIHDSKFSGDPPLVYTEIKKRYKHCRFKEIIASREQICGGIGLIYLD